MYVYVALNDAVCTMIHFLDLTVVKLTKLLSTSSCYCYISRTLWAL